MCIEKTSARRQFLRLVRSDKSIRKVAIARWLEIKHLLKFEMCKCTGCSNEIRNCRRVDNCVCRRQNVFILSCAKKRCGNYSDSASTSGTSSRVSRYSSFRITSDGNPAASNERYSEAILRSLISPRDKRNLRSMRWRTNAAGSVSAAESFNADSMCLSGIPRSLQIARNAKLPLFARDRSRVRELFCVARVVEILVRFQPLDHHLDQLFIFATPRQCFFHLMHGMGAAHQDLDRRFIQARFGFDLPRFAEHTERIGSAGREVKYGSYCRPAERRACFQLRA